jgi:H+/Cl- antiporter ClcA
MLVPGSQIGVMFGRLVAAVRAPLTGICLAVEMTSNANLLFRSGPLASGRWS